MNALDLTNPNLLKLNYKLSCFKTHQIIMMMNDADQMNECFAEMERLKVKMETLEQQRKINEENETLRKTTMEPNLKVLENWLVDYREAIESINNVQGIDDRKMLDKRNYISKTIDELMRNKNNRRSRHNKNINYDEIETMKHNLEYDSFCNLSRKCLKITRIASGHDNKMEEISFIDSSHGNPQPSDVMKAHIEATYNLFNIINKRLDDIEKKLALFDYVN